MSFSKYGGLFMEKLKLVDKLKNKANISYEEAKDALEKSNWDMLEAMLYLEAHGKVQKPSLSIFYTNESKESYNENGEEVNLKKDTNENNFENNVCQIFAIETGDLLDSVKKEPAEKQQTPHNSTRHLLLSSEVSDSQNKQVS